MKISLGCLDIACTVPYHSIYTILSIFVNMQPNLTMYTNSTRGTKTNIQVMDIRHMFIGL